MKRTVNLNDDVTISVQDIMYIQRLVSKEKPAIEMYMHGIPNSFLFTFNGEESRNSVFELIVRRMEDLNFDTREGCH